MPNWRIGDGKADADGRGRGRGRVSSPPAGFVDFTSNMIKLCDQYFNCLHNYHFHQRKRRVENVVSAESEE